VPAVVALPPPAVAAAVVVPPDVVVAESDRLAQPTVTASPSAMIPRKIRMNGSFRVIGYARAGPRGLDPGPGPPGVR
jgi:hypothetical protein